MILLPRSLEASGLSLLRIRMMRITLSKKWTKPNYMEGKSKLRRQEDADPTIQLLELTVDR